MYYLHSPLPTYLYSAASSLQNWARTTIAERMENFSFPSFFKLKVILRGFYFREWNANVFLETTQNRAHTCIPQPTIFSGAFETIINAQLINYAIEIDTWILISAAAATVPSFFCDHRNIDCLIIQNLIIVYLIFLSRNIIQLAFTKCLIYVRKRVSADTKSKNQTSFFNCFKYVHIF